MSRLGFAFLMAVVILTTGCVQRYRVDTSDIRGIVEGRPGPTLIVQSNVMTRVVVTLNGAVYELSQQSLLKLSLPLGEYISSPCGEMMRVSVALTAPDFRDSQGNTIRSVVREWAFQTCSRQTIVSTWVVEMSGGTLYVNGW